MSTTNALGNNNSGSIDTLLDRVFELVDENKDGKLSSNEFGSFMTKLLSRADAAPAERKQTAGSADRPTAPEPFYPVASRYVFAGFSPQDHLGETPNIITPKYAVYNELARLSNDPSFDPKNFAQTAANNLQALFGNPMWTDGKPVFRAIDGETLLYGDEYVHFAPTGYALRAGEYDPTAPGEFFWGFL